MRRRTLIAFLGATFATWPLTVGAEPAGKVARVGQSLLLRADEVIQ